MSGEIAVSEEIFINATNFLDSRVILHPSISNTGCVLPIRRTAMSKPKVIIFDLLTALLDSWSVWNAAAGSAETGLRWRLRYLDITFDCGEYQPYEEQIARAAREVGLPQSAADTLIQEYDKIKPWPEVPRVLRKLRERGYVLGVITNCSKNLGHRAAKRCDVPFDAVLTAEEGKSRFHW